MLELCRCPNIYGPDCIYILMDIRQEFSNRCLRLTWGKSVKCLQGGDKEKRMEQFAAYHT